MQFEEKHKPPRAERPLGLGLAVLVIITMLLSGLSQSASAEARPPSGAPSEPLPLSTTPAVGDHEVRVLAPTVVELRRFSAVDVAADYQVEGWDVGAKNRPAPSDLSVRAGAETIGVASVGVTRQITHGEFPDQKLIVVESIVLVLDRAIASGADVVVEDTTGKWIDGSMHFATTTDPARVSGSVHVSHAGFEPDSTKFAQVGTWLGELGELPVAAGTGFRVIDLATGEAALTGSLTIRSDRDQAAPGRDHQLVGQADFTSLDRPGRYRVEVEGHGSSYPFVIANGASGVFARTYALGFYHQRDGFEKTMPHTRFEDGAAHTQPAKVITDAAEFETNAGGWPTILGVEAAGWEQIEIRAAESGLTTDELHPASRITGYDSLLYKPIRTGAIDVTGGHWDAGDYTRYMINSSEIVENLMFAVDNLPGVAGLDHLGIPESCDGVSDVLQEAAWEVEYIAKMQDDDGGFFYRVSPEFTKFELHGLPSEQNGQVLFPKTTSSTAQGVSALALIGSSPTFKAWQPALADEYLNQAIAGWDFLERAWAEHTYRGAFQVIRNDGENPDHEVAAAAAALFAATGETRYHDMLLELLPHPDSEDGRVWGWKRASGHLGGALRTYVFAPLNGRLTVSDLDQAWHDQARSELVAAGRDVVARVEGSAYGAPYAFESKRQRDAGWYMPAAEAFHAAVADQLDADPAFGASVDQSLAYVAGSNPNDMSTLSGVGWERPDNWVHQWQVNAHRALPPTGHHQAAITEGLGRLQNYPAANGGNALNGIEYPGYFGDDGRGGWPMYERWTDMYNTGDEMTINDLSKGFVSSLYRFGPNAGGSATCRSGAVAIDAPSLVTFGEPVTLSPVATGVDLTNAVVTWDLPGGDYGFTDGPIEWTPSSAGEGWIELEVMQPDGHRYFDRSLVTVRQAAAPQIEDWQTSGISTSDDDLVGWYRLDGDWSDATGQLPDLNPGSGVGFDPTSFGWADRPNGQALRVAGQGADASVTIPAGIFGDAGPITIEAMMYFESFVAETGTNTHLLSLHQEWNAALVLQQSQWKGLTAEANGSRLLAETGVESDRRRGTWKHVKLEVTAAEATLWIDGETIGQAVPAAAGWMPERATVLTLGGFNGWVDEIVIRQGGGSGKPSSNGPAPEQVDQNAGPAGDNEPVGESLAEPVEDDEDGEPLGEGLNNPVETSSDLQVEITDTSSGGGDLRLAGTITSPEAITWAGASIQHESGLWWRIDSFGGHENSSVKLDCVPCTTTTYSQVFEGLPAGEYRVIVDAVDQTGAAGTVEVQATVVPHGEAPELRVIWPGPNDQIEGMLTMVYARNQGAPKSSGMALRDSSGRWLSSAGSWVDTPTILPLAVEGGAPTQFAIRKEGLGPLSPGDYDVFAWVTSATSGHATIHETTITSR